MMTAQRDEKNRNHCIKKADETTSLQTSSTYYYHITGCLMSAWQSFWFSYPNQSSTLTQLMRTTARRRTII